MRNSASRTAVLVCQGRAAAHERIAVGRFADPVAMRLLREHERTVVEQVRAEQPPKRMRERMSYEFVRGCAALMAPRTVAIDDAIREHDSTQVVIVGAGLDTRSWRMRELADTTVFEVDHPATQADKRDRLGDTSAAAGQLHFVTDDLTARTLDGSLDGAGHDAHVPTTWVWEGVVPYLTAEQVTASVAAIAGRSATGSRLVINYQTPSARASIGRTVGRVMMRLARSPDPWSAEPHRSHWTPQQLSSLVDHHGFTTRSDRSLLDISHELGLSVPSGDLGASLPNGHILIAERR